MLVLSRKTKETILIGDSIRVTVVKIRGGTTFLGIEAPRDVIVDREEVALRRQAEEEIPQ